MGTAFGREGCFRTAAMATASMPPLLVVFLAAISHTRSVAEDQGQPRLLERAREEEEQRTAVAATAESAAAEAASTAAAACRRGARGR